MMLSVSWLISRAQSGTVVGLTSPEMYLAVGEQITVTVRITDVAGLYSAEFVVPYPSDLVTITDADLGTGGVQIMPGDCLALDFVVANEVDASTDEIRYAILQLAPSQPFTGSCSLAYIHFTALGEGYVPLVFNEVQITTQQAEPLDHETREITLTIDSTSPTSVVTVPAVSRFPPASLIWTAADAWSGIEAVSMWYRFEDGDWDLLSDQLGSTGLMEFSFPDGEGQYQFITQAVDGAGNVEEFTGHEVATTVYEPIRLYMPLISRR
ncbi:MAG: cohesin domain-containing protein [Anaerolineae bacterium]|nr:cohesin domain-containing protein [Anaerolineae bacterium]